MAECSDYENSELALELEMLREIFINELVIATDSSGRAEELSLTLHPATGDDVDQQWVCLTLVLSLPHTYPSDIPDIEIKNPRGLADDHVYSLCRTLRNMAEESRGGQMLYELIDHAKESLTAGNVPRVQCVVCLEELEEGDDFTRTQCYHYLHSHCLLTYVNHSLREWQIKHEASAQHHQTQPNQEVLCPVCRESISYDLGSLRQAAQPQPDDIKYIPSAEMQQLQRKMANLLKKQKKKGGIIDLEEEKNRYLLPAELIIHLDSADVSSNDRTCKDDQSIGVDNSKLGADLPANQRPLDRPAGRGYYRGSSRSAEFRKPRFPQERQKKFRRDDFRDSTDRESFEQRGYPGKRSGRGRGSGGRYQGKEHRGSSYTTSNLSPRDNTSHKKDVVNYARNDQHQQYSEKGTDSTTQLRKVQTWPKKSFQEDFNGPLDDRHKSGGQSSSRGQGQRRHIAKQRTNQSTVIKETRQNIRLKSNENNATDKSRREYSEVNSHIPGTTAPSEHKSSPSHPPGIKSTGPPPGFDLASTRPIPSRPPPGFHEFR